MPDPSKRFIEESFPVREVSEHSVREKNIRHGHISTLHIWWARRPLASSRATNYAALIPAPDDREKWGKNRQFIIDFSKWENSLNRRMIERARKDILHANGGKAPKVLDPFAGGGAIPLEALRLGCETYSSDLNPVSVLIQKCTLEYPQKYGKPGEIEVEEFGAKRRETVPNKLLEDVKKWGNRVLEGAKKEIGKFYPEESDGSIPVGYIWARTIPCQNPTCGAEIPLMRQFWLAKKANKKIALSPYVVHGKVKFKVVGDGYEEMPADFDPNNGTVSRAVATCQVCGSVVDANTTRKLFQQAKAGQRMVAVVLHKPGVRGKRYRIATEQEVRIFRDAEEYGKEKREKLMSEWGVDPVPNEPLKRVPFTFGVINVWVYNMNTWGDLFNSRQKLALITFVEKVRMAHQEMLDEGLEEDYAKAVVSYLALGVDMTAAFTNTLARWENTSEAIKQLYSRQALPMLWDYAEGNPFSGSSGSFETGSEYYFKVMEHCSQSNSVPSTVTQSSATNLPYPDNTFDAVCTDPPYYDNVPYSYLSDFFYAWLKRSLVDLYPELFSTPLTPKTNEIVAYSNGPGGFEEGKHRFEKMLKKSFAEINRVLKPNGIATIVYAHKTTAGWETIINSLLDSGLVVTGSWPVNTEMKARLRARESAVLASSIYVVARKMQRQKTAFYKEVKLDLENYLSTKLEQLWNEGISGPDFFIAAIGTAIEVFGKYEKVIDYEGTAIRADRLLGDVRRIATDFSVRRILHDGFAGDITDMTRFYVLWRWNYGAVSIHFDEARKLATGCGIDLAYEWNRRGFVRKNKEFIRVLGPQDRNLDDIRYSSELIDVLHRALLLWEKGKRDEIADSIRDSGLGETDMFYGVAQAIAETLPDDNKEKKLLDGFLYGSERLKSEIREGSKQEELFK